MTATDRLFFALFPPVTTAASIYALQQDLRVRHGLWGRALAIDRLHIPLCNVGDHAGLPAQLVAKAREAASRVSASTVEVTFDSALSFSGRPRNRPFVLRNRHDASGVEALQRRLGAEMTACGLGRFVRPYTPHMTLLYDTADVTEHSIEPISWTASEIVLVHSMLGQTRHIRLGAWPLGEQVAYAPLLEAAI